MKPDTSPLRVISWNLHRCRGNDGVTDPARTIDTLRDEVCQNGVDLLVLQEADGECPPHASLLNIARIEAETGLRCIHTEPHHRWGPQSDGFLGVILFVHPRFTVKYITLLDLPGHCHRGAVVVELETSGQAFHLIGTHLSLWQGLRMAQMRIISQHLFRRAPMANILAGDLNEWRPWGGLALSKWVMQVQFSGPAPATFPINRPIVPLDRILTSGPARVLGATVLDGPAIRMTSDHRPLLADIALDVSSG